jgi:glycosyltransferase involved in cell wall biosynthesis
VPLYLDGLPESPFFCIFKVSVAFVGFRFLLNFGLDERITGAHPVLRRRNSLHIAYLITRTDEIGGAQVHVFELARCLLTRGIQVTVLGGGEGTFAAMLRRAHIPYQNLLHLVRPIQPRTDVRCFWELRTVLRRLKPDLVTVHSSKAGWLGRLVARSLNLPVIFTVHGWAFTEGVPPVRRTLYALAERVAAPFADRIITVSEYDRQLALRHHIASATKLVTVHNGIPDVESSLRAQPGIGERVRLIMVARFSPPKDQVLLVRALASLRALPWELELIGDGPQRVVCEQLVHRLALRDRVHFLGERQDVAERLAQAHIFILVSNYEGLPLSILEAMRAGLPVVASDVGGVHEAVLHEKTGLLFPRGDVNALCNVLHRLIVQPELRAQMGSAGRQRYEHTFTLEHMVAKTWAVYEAVIQQKASGET